MKSPLFAAVISFPFPGAGLLYCGYYSMTIILVWPFYAMWIASTTVAHSVSPSLGAMFNAAFLGFRLLECLCAAGCAIEVNEKNAEEPSQPKKLKFYKYEPIGTPVEDVEDEPALETPRYSVQIKTVPWV